MTKSIKVAVDVMGGDFAPLSALQGILFALKKSSDVSFVLYGNKAVIEKNFHELSSYKSHVSIVDCSSVISSSQNISSALRNYKSSSMGKAILSVRNGENHGIVSAGNTGAFMGLCKLLLKTMPGISRPPLTTCVPNYNNRTVVLDLGANLECSTENLVEFAIAGNIYAKYTLNIKKPKIGLVNVGVEEIKGKDSIKEAAKILKSMNESLNFIGFIEGNDIYSGKVDVAVIDGFSGNIALKSSEEIAKFFLSVLKQQISFSSWRKIGFFLLKPAFKKMQAKFDPRRYNGAIFLGLNGVAVKSHGNADAFSFSNALETTISLIKEGINESIQKQVELYHSKKHNVERIA